MSFSKRRVVIELDVNDNKDVVVAIGVYVVCGGDGGSGGGCDRIMVVVIVMWRRVVALYE